MIAVNQVVVTAPALRADIANACSSFDHLGRTGEQCRVRSGRTCSIIETDKATGDKDPYVRDGSGTSISGCADYFRSTPMSRHPRGPSALRKVPILLQKSVEG